MQLASISTFCMLYYQFSSEQCDYKTNPSGSTLSNPFGVDIKTIFMINSVVSICLKFASVVCLRIALDEYQELNANCAQFMFSLLFSLTPNALMAPMYTRDHVNCIGKNFMMTQAMAEKVCSVSLLLICIPLILLILIPNFMKKFACCKKKKQTIVSENQEDFK